MQKRTVPLFASACLLWCQQVCSADLPGLRLRHGDWELACDNTRTCRAAGYQKDGERHLPASVQLVRKAGPGELISAEFQIAPPENGLGVKTRAKLPRREVVKMTISGRALGYVEIDPERMVAKLSPKQVVALVVALRSHERPSWANTKKKWIVSVKGAAAVLSKMDEFQGRVGTPGAMLSKGDKPETDVLPPLPMPTVIAAPVPSLIGSNRIDFWQASTKNLYS